MNKFYFLFHGILLSLAVVLIAFLNMELGKLIVVMKHMKSKHGLNVNTEADIQYYWNS